MKPAEVLRSRGNPLLLRLRRLALDGTAYRKQGEVWVEGEHLGSAALARGWALARVVIAESAAELPRLRHLIDAAHHCTVVADDRYRELSTLDSPSQIGCVLELPEIPAIDASLETVVLDRVQDPGNVGSVLRSAAGLGVAQVLATRGTAALWSPKVLRAAMGAHFGLRLVEGLSAADVAQASLGLVTTSSHQGVPLPEAPLPAPCAWVFGHEGQGVDETLAEHCTHRVSIPLPGGEESLNVAAAAAICLYEAMRRRRSAAAAAPE